MGQLQRRLEYVATWNNKYGQHVAGILGQHAFIHYTIIYFN